MVYYSGESNIVNQYIRFSQIADDCIEVYDTVREAVQEIFRICQEQDILTEFLARREKELMKDMDDFLYNQELWYNLFVEEERQSARDSGLAEGLAEGHASGMIEGQAAGVMLASRKNAENFLKMGVLTVEQIAAGTQLPIDEVIAMQKGLAGR